MKRKVLFICVHNSARSQIAEELLRKLDGDHFEVESAGFYPTTINPLVVEVMKEEGIDLTEKKTQSAFALVKAQKFYGYVITVCDRGQEENCPVFPGTPKRIQWDLDNPENYTGTHEEKMKKVRELKEQTKKLLIEFIENLTNKE